MSDPFEVARRESRYRLQIPVELYVGKEAKSLRTEDISFSGGLPLEKRPGLLQALDTLTEDGYLTEAGEKRRWSGLGALGGQPPGKNGRRYCQVTSQPLLKLLVT